MFCQPGLKIFSAPTPHVAEPKPENTTKNLRAVSRLQEVGTQATALLACPRTSPTQDMLSSLHWQNDPNEVCRGEPFAPPLHTKPCVTAAFKIQELTIQILTDSMTFMFYMAGGHSHPHHRVPLTAIHLPGLQNTLVDRWSRHFSSAHEWIIQESVFHVISQERGHPSLGPVHG